MSRFPLLNGPNFDLPGARKPWVCVAMRRDDLAVPLPLIKKQSNNRFMVTWYVANGEEA
jgi:hypothetical protein